MFEFCQHNVGAETLGLACEHAIPDGSLRDSTFGTDSFHLNSMVLH